MELQGRRHVVDGVDGTRVPPPAAGREWQHHDYVPVIRRFVVDDDNCSEWFDDHDNRCGWRSDLHDGSAVGRGRTGACAHGADTEHGELDKSRVHHHSGRMEHRLGVPLYTGTRFGAVVRGLRDAGRRDSVWHPGRQ